jgi:hypothetical protein
MPLIRETDAVFKPVQSFIVKDMPEAAAILKVTHLLAQVSITASERLSRISLCH